MSAWEERVCGWRVPFQSSNVKILCPRPSDPILTLILTLPFSQFVGIARYAAITQYLNDHLIFI